MNFLKAFNILLAAPAFIEETPLEIGAPFGTAKISIKAFHHRGCDNEMPKSAKTTLPFDLFLDVA